MMKIGNGQYEKLGMELYRSLPDYRSKYLNPAEATPSQIACLMGLLRSYRFEDGRRINNALEVGVNQGISDLYMLKAGSENPDFHLYGIEKMTDTFFGSATYAECTPEELAHWTFCKGQTTFDITSILREDEKLDMIFIDGAHAHPYPLMDMIMLRPYLAPDALIIFHDVETYIEDGEFGNCYLYTGWRGEKYLNWNVDNQKLEPVNTEYMGICRLPAEDVLQESLLELANLQIDESFFPYTDAQMAARGGQLGLDVPMLATSFLPFLLRKYDKPFALKFWDALSRRVEEHNQQWIYLKHRNRISHWYQQQILALHGRVTALEQRLAQLEK